MKQPLTLPINEVAPIGIGFGEWLGAGVILTKDEYERRCRTIQHRETARRLGISEEDLWQRKAELARAWEDGGGREGAKARNEWLQNFLNRKAPNVKSSHSEL